MSDFQNHSPSNNAPTMSIKDWLITFVIMMIPIVNLVMMIIWAIKAENPNKRNYFIATWIMLFAGTRMQEQQIDESLENQNGK